MKTILIILVCYLMSSSLNLISAQESVIDENLGMGIVELSMEREESAKEYFRRSGSINAKAILERIENTRGSFHFQFDYTDPILIGYYDYIVHVSKNPKYSFFTELVRELDVRNPNKELGKLGLFYNAYFSPKSTYLTIYCTNKTILLESKTGNIIELIDHSNLLEITDAHIIFSKNEEFLLRYLEKGIEEEAKKIITYEHFKDNKVIWEREMINRILVSFSKDYSKVIIFNYIAGLDTTDIYVYEIEVNTGKELEKKYLRNIEWDSIKDLFANMTSIQIEYFPESYILEPTIKIESPDGKYSLYGNRTYGNFTLKRIEDNKPIREFRFASGIE